MKALFALILMLSIPAVSILGMMWGWGLQAENWGWIAFSYLWVMGVSIFTPRLNG